MTVGAATLALSQSISAFHTYLPTLSEVRQKSPQNDPAFAADVRLGELAAAGLAIGVGAIASSLTKSATPAIIGLLMAGSLIMLYESVLRADRPFEVS